jgi:predicted lipoprotein with Yx(FWY)xxD motif
MRIPAVLLAGATIALGACDTMSGPPPPPPPPSDMPAGGAATLTTATNAPFGTYVVDSSGRSVYVLEGTRGGSGINRCSGQCLKVWPPLMGGPSPVVATGLNPGIVQAVSGYTGSQLSYGGWPLYYYQHDHVPSDTMGNGVRDAWGTWYLLSPSGEPIRPRY